MKFFRYLFSMFIMLAGVAGVRGAIIVDDTWASGTRTNWALPDSAPWYSWTSGSTAFIGVETNSLYMTNTPGVTRYFWTYFTSNAPELTMPYLGGSVTNNMSNTTNAFYGYPVDVAVGEMLQATFSFSLADVSLDSGSAAVRFGLMDYDTNNVAGAYQGRVTRDTSNITKSGTNVSGYRLDIPIYQNLTNNPLLGFRVRVNITNDSNALDPLGKASVWSSLGSGPSLTNYSGFQPGTLYTVAWSVARYATSNVLSASLSGGAFTNLSSGATVTNFTHSETDGSGINYHRFDNFMLRCDTASIPTTLFTFKEFKVEKLPITFAITLVEKIAPDAFRLRWNSVAGQNYEIQYKTNLGDPNWIPIETVAASGGSTTWTNSGITGSSLRFYRVLNRP